MILNTLDNLGKFEPKGDEGYFIGYSMSNKAFRVFNKRTRRIKENLHVEFLENKAIVQGAGPNWLFDIDSLTKSINYMPVDAVESPIPTVSSPVPTACLNDSSETSSEARLVSKRVANQEETPSLDNILSLTNRPIGTKWVLKNKKDERGIVVRNKARLVAQGLTQEEAIDYDEVFAPVARIEAIRLFLAYASFMGFTVYQMDVKSAFLYGTIDEEVYVMQPPRFHDPEYPAKVYKVEKAMYGLHQAPKNEHSCVACQTGKQHQATCKAKLMSSISQPLQMLHMDLFGPTSVMSINHKKYYLVVTDDFSRFSWVFFLATKDETSKAKAVNTACYVLIKTLVKKSHNKTPYELLNGRTPRLDFMRPFGCPVTILNTLYPLGKFTGKADEGFLVGYSVTSKAFRVFNTKTKRVKENLHVRLLRNQSIRKIKPTALDRLMSQEKEASDAADALRKDTSGTFSAGGPSSPHPDAFIPTNTLLHKAIGTKWVYRNKKDERGIVARNKARMVAQGHKQEEGIDYDEVFAHVARIGYRVLLSLYLIYGICFLPNGCQKCLLIWHNRRGGVW
nr:retrovirus-related Pol polyprotein from transposon TNT 1-94 [Tanacetum cinerariifolium]